MGNARAMERSCKYEGCRFGNFTQCAQCKKERRWDCRHKYCTSRCSEADVFIPNCQCTAHRTHNGARWRPCNHKVEDGHVLCTGCEKHCTQIISSDMFQLCQMFLMLQVAYINTFRSATAAFVTYVKDTAHILVIKEDRNNSQEWGFPGGRRLRNELPSSAVLRQCWTCCSATKFEKKRSSKLLSARDRSHLCIPCK